MNKPTIEEKIEDDLNLAIYETVHIYNKNNTMKLENNLLTEMMSHIPTEKGENVDKQILRAGIISELDAISLYEQLASVSTDENVKKVLLDIANEEKTHVAEFQKLLLDLDNEQKKEMKSGAKEVEDITEIKKLFKKMI